MKIARKRRPLDKKIFGIIAVIWSAVCLFPMWILICVTFSSPDRNMTKTFFPNSWADGVRYISEALNIGNLWKAVGDTFLYTVLAVIGMIIICSLAAYEFRFYEFPLKKLLFSVVMGSMMLPMILYVVPLYRFVFSIGMADTIAGVALPSMVSPLSVFILLQFMEEMPVELIESARLDGAGHFRVFFSVVFPLMRNGIITASVLLFLRVWGQFLWPSLVTATNVTSMSVTISNIMEPLFSIDPRIKIAAMLLAVIPPLAFYLIFQKFIIKGIAMSGIKG